LARILLCHKYAKVVELIQNTLHSPEFLNRFRKNPTDFSRKGKIGFFRLVLLIAFSFKSSIQIELDRFFQSIHETEFPERRVTKGAFSRARMKLVPEVFKALNLLAVDFFAANFRAKTWRGHRLIAVDGTKFRLPETKDIVEHFGVQSGGKGKKCPMGLFSQMFDPLSKISLAFEFSGLRVGEREQARRLFSNLRPKDLVLLDRGYPAAWLFNLVVDMGADFCARLPANWKIVKAFLESGREEAFAVLGGDEIAPVERPSRSGGKRLPTLRLIRVELDSGEIEVLATTLVDSEKYPVAVFGELYFHRWPVEEDYKVMKCPMETERFTGKTKESIYQDVYAAVFVKNLTTLFAFETNERLESEGVKKKWEHKTNFTQALSKAKSQFPKLFVRNSDESKFHRIIDYILSIFYKTTEPVRPGRKNERKKSGHPKVYHMNAKPIA